MAIPTNLPATFSTGAILTAAQMNDLRGAFRILQVVSTTVTGTFATTSSSYTDVTGLSATITPSNTSSKILVIVSLSGTGQTANTNFFAQLVRGSTAIGVGGASGSRRTATSVSRDQTFPSSLVMMHLDSPSTTSSTTYKVQVTTQGGGTVYVNRSEGDSDNISSPRTASAITLLEVSA